MAWEDIAERLEGTGWIGAGIGAVILAPLLFPAVARGLRPAAKKTIKGYLSLSAKTRELVAETGEQWQDLMAEARSEHANRGSELVTFDLSGEDEAGPEGAPESEKVAVVHHGVVKEPAEGAASRQDAALEPQSS